MTWKEFKRLAWLFIQKLFKKYNKEIIEFIDGMIDMAFKNIETKLDELEPSMRKAIRNEILAEYIINKIDTSIPAGRSQLANIVHSTMEKYLKEA